MTLAETGGVASYATALLPALPAELDVVVAARGDGPLRDAAAAAGMRYVGLRHLRRSIHPLRDVLAVLELIVLIRRLRPAIVHAHSSKAGILGRVAAWLARAPVRIFTVHGWSFAAYAPPASWLFLWLERLVRPLTTVITCPAAAVRQQGIAARACSPEATVVIPNAVDVAGFEPPAPAAGAPLVLSVGRLAFPKDFGVLLRALAAVEPGLARAAIAGDGPQRAELEDELAALDLAGRVELLGTRDDVPALLAASSVFVLASRSECLPMSVIEAMAAGLPVVASAVGGVPELVEDGQTGLLVPPGDAGALAAAIARLAGDEELRRAMGEAGRRRAQERFDVGRFRRAHLELYRERLALSARPRPRGARRSTRS